MDNNWLDVINARIAEFDSYRDRVNKVLLTIKNELEAKINKPVDFRLVDEDKLVWEICIDKKKVDISVDEIQKSAIKDAYDKDGNVYGHEVMTTKEALVDVILNKFKWLNF